MDESDREWMTLGDRFWSDPRVREVIDELGRDELAGEDLPQPLARMRVLFAVEDTARAAVQRAVAEIRTNTGFSWQRLADAVSLSLSALLERYDPEYRRKALERQRKRRRGN